MQYHFFDLTHFGREIEACPGSNADHQADGDETNVSQCGHRECAQRGGSHAIGHQRALEPSLSGSTSPSTPSQMQSSMRAIAR